MSRLFAFFLSIVSVIMIMIVTSSAQSARTLLDLRTGPIVNSADVSNLALVLSVEFPTTGAAYKSPNTATAYDSTKKYLGYWNSTTCYAYNGTTSDGYFEPNGATISITNYNCNSGGAGDGFSGNFLNFAATSSTDILRYALTGGDRYIDEVGNTILQRAVLIGDNGGLNTSFYRNSSNMPTRSLTTTQSAALTPFGSRVMYVQSCEDRVIFQTVNGGTCTTPGNLRAFDNSAGTSINSDLKARIKVCDATEGPVRTELCKQYPDTNYKPVGEIQKNADKVRVAAFGYLLNSPASGFQDWDNWYGGVLRAPMKFAGPQQKSSSGVVSNNPQTEWDATTGVYVANPLSEGSFANSGVINYVNRFGRSGQYKRHDPVGELYYESVRYFQGKQPTDRATTDPTKGVYTAAMLDNFPIYTTWSDPMQTTCQRNFSLTIGDHQSAKDNYIPGVSDVGGETRAADGTGVGALNAATWESVVSSFETNGTTTYVDSQGVTRTANGNATTGVTGVIAGNSGLATKTQAGQTSNGNNVGYAWAGVAYWANTQPIRADKPLARIRSFVIDVNEGASTTVSQYRQRALYLAGKYGGFADVGPDGSPATGEGSPFKTYVSGGLTTSDTEWLASDGSTLPAGYFLASQPERLILAIRKIFASAAKPSGNIAGIATNVSALNESQSSGARYKTQNNPDWSGTLLRTSISYNTTTASIELSPTGSNVWDAGNILTGIQTGTTTLAPFPTPANRNIVSYSSSSLSGVTFTWASLDAAVQTSLKTDPATAVVEADAEGQARLDYIRGDRTAESDVSRNYRPRNVIMGDSINSAPALKGKPSDSIVDSSYRAFISTYAARTPTVYIGSNDGMLHAFKAPDSASDTSGGQELFAYVPRAVSLKLNKLTDAGYVKEAYVDGAMTVDEARIYKSATSSVGWGTALVSGMGGGAKGLFALDVTTPYSFGSGNVLWEFTNADDADMGHLLSAPKIVKLALTGDASASPNYKWFAMVTSGYNNYVSGGAGDKQALFLLSLEKAPGTAWAINTNYFKIVADNTSYAAANTSSATGMGMPGVAIGSKGNVLHAYAGDLQGNVWKFDLKDAYTTWHGSTKASVLFIAKNAAGDATQPITVSPVVTPGRVGGFQITFGTGKFIEPSDGLGASAAQQTMYGIWDAEDGDIFQRIATGSSPTINGLISRTLTVTSGTVTVSVTGPSFQYGTSSGQYRGWYADLSTSMERIALRPALKTGRIFFNSTIPGGDPCLGSGQGIPYLIDLYTGTQSPRVIPPDIFDPFFPFPPPPDPIGTGSASWSSRSSSGRYTVTTKDWDNIDTPTSSTIGGRISWREITNFQ